jgi:ABC-2 type transport system ATP-binding protein
LKGADADPQQRAMLEVDTLRKVFGELVAVDGVSFACAAGRILGLLGPNGAGKSTTIGCISGLLRPAGGTVRIAGHDVVGAPVAAKRLLGVVPQELALYEDLDARTNLRFFGSIYGLSGRALHERADAVLARIGLADRGAEPVKNFSGGMKRRLNFGCGLVHGPKLLLLDEPTAGVDPQSRARLLELVRELAREGAAVVYTTHYMEEAEALCDHIAIVDHGKLLASGTLAELRQRLGGRELVRLSGRFDPAAVRAALATAEVEIVQCDGDVVALSARGASARLADLLLRVQQSGAELRDTVVKQPNLESLFLELTGRELRQ